jgi:hypothetical protein
VHWHSRRRNHRRSPPFLAEAGKGSRRRQRRRARTIKYVANFPRLLPVYCAGLDDTAIPSLLAELDSSGAEIDIQSVTHKLSHVMVRLHGLSLLDTQSSIPGPPSPDIWARVWP